MKQDKILKVRFNVQHWVKDKPFFLNPLVTSPAYWESVFFCPTLVKARELRDKMKQQTWKNKERWRVVRIVETLCG